MWSHTEGGRATGTMTLRYHHELDIDKMEKVPHFCHDYQNNNGRCTRPNCTYIHATKEEQNAFETTGVLPRVLAERNTAAASNMNAETIPQIAMFINESYMTQPPPAPWPPLPPAPGAPGALGAPRAPPQRAPPALPPQLLHSVPRATQPPPPPTPAPVPVPVPAPTPAPPNVHQICPSPTSYYSMQAQNPAAMFTLNQPPPNLEDFDASKPPPPIPTHMGSNQQKRKLDADGNNAASSKTKKGGCSEEFCESCVERQTRIDAFKLQMDSLHNEEETQVMIYKKKLQEFEMGREILKSLIEPDFLQIFDNLIEAVQTPQIPANLNSGNTFIPGPAADNMQGQQRTEHVPSTSREDETQTSRRLNTNYNYTNQSSDLVNLVMETIKNNTGHERFSTVESDMGRLNNTGPNSHLANGHKTPQAPINNEPARYGVAAGFSGAGMPSQDFGPQPHYPVAGPSGYAGAALGPPPAYAVPYHMTMPPPPNRHYYPNPPASNVPNMHFNGAIRVPVPGPSQGMQPPSSPAPHRANQPNAPN